MGKVKTALSGAFLKIMCVLLLPSFLALCGCDSVKAGKRSFFAMDTLIDMTVYGGNSEKALEDCEAAVIALEERLSTEIPGSEIWEINRSNGSPTAVSERTASLISAALDVSVKSSGAFDITVYPLVKAWGFIGGDYRVPADAEISGLLELVDYARVKVENNTVALGEGMALDLGGIAKGYASDILKQELEKNGITSAVISLGGNVLAHGSRPGGGAWRIGILKPDGSGDIAGVLSVSDTVISTSGTYQRYFEKDGVIYHHILDPATGRPANSGLKSVTVVCESGATADALSTTLLILGEEKALEYYDRYGGFEAVLITDDGRMICTGGLKSSLSDVDEAYTLQYS